MCVHIQSTKGTASFYQLVAPGNLCLISLVPRPRLAFRYLITLVLEGVLQGLDLASFPGLPRFYLPFAFTTIHASGRLAKNGEGLGSIYHVNGVRWMQGGQRGGGAQLPKLCTGSSV